MLPLRLGQPCSISSSSAHRLRELCRDGRESFFASPTNSSSAARSDLALLVPEALDRGTSQSPPTQCEHDAEREGLVCVGELGEGSIVADRGAHLLDVVLGRFEIYIWATARRSSASQASLSEDAFRSKAPKEFELAMHMRVAGG